LLVAQKKILYPRPVGWQAPRRTDTVVDNYKKIPDPFKSSQCAGDEIVEALGEKLT